MGTNEEPWITRKSINWLYKYIKNNKNSISHLNKNGLFIVDNAERKRYQYAIKNYIPKNWVKYEFPTSVDTTIIWIKS